MRDCFNPGDVTAGLNKLCGGGSICRLNPLSFASRQVNPEPCPGEQKYISFVQVCVDDSGLVFEGEPPTASPTASPTRSGPVVTAPVTTTSTSTFSDFYDETKWEQLVRRETDYEKERILDGDSCAEAEKNKWIEGVVGEITSKSIRTLCQDSKYANVSNIRSLRSDLIVATQNIYRTNESVDCSQFPHLCDLDFKYEKLTTAEEEVVQDSLEVTFRTEEGELKPLEETPFIGYAEVSSSVETWRETSQSLRVDGLENIFSLGQNERVLYALTFRQVKGRFLSESVKILEDRWGLTVVEFIPPRTYHFFLSPEQAKSIKGGDLYSEIEHLFPLPPRMKAVLPDCSIATIDCTTIAVHITPISVDYTSKVALKLKELIYREFQLTVRVKVLADIIYITDFGDSFPITKIIRLLAFAPDVIEVTPRYRLKHDNSTLRDETVSITRRRLLSSSGQTSIQGDLVLTDLHNKSLDGSLQILMVGDTGLDTASCFFADSNVPVVVGQNISSHRKLVSLLSLTGDTDLGVSTDGDHGTHVSGIAVGESQDGLGAGVAPKAKLVFANMMANGTFSPPNNIYTGYFVLGHNLGARVSSNSWNGDSNRYNIQDMHTDIMTFRNDEFLVVYSAGNTGDYGMNTNGIPANSKNSISVGASFLEDPNTLASFSSRGPTSDGRTKPDLVAPGVDIESAWSGQNCGVGVKSGTSQAAPYVAGLALLVRQFFMEGYYPTGSKIPFNTLTPTSALLKAMLINSARPLERIEDAYPEAPCRNQEPGDYYPDPCVARLGSVPSPFQGFGATQISNVLLLQSMSQSTLQLLEVYDRETLSNSPGGGSQKMFNIQSSSASTISDGTLRVTLVWTDPAATIKAATALVNDLDLLVNYAGSSFHPNGRAVPDRLNNVEQVDLQLDGVNSLATVQINVTLAALNRYSSQKFALVITHHDMPLPTPPCNGYLCGDITSWKHGFDVGGSSSPGGSSTPKIPLEQYGSDCASHTTCEACIINAKSNCDWCGGINDLGKVYGYCQDKDYLRINCVSPEETILGVDGTPETAVCPTIASPTPAPVAEIDPNATFDFSGCSGGSGEFEKPLTKGMWAPVGIVPTGQIDLIVQLASEEDLDITIHDLDDTTEYAEGKTIVGWCKTPCNKGLLAASFSEAVNYQGMQISYSGYNGVEGQKGNEYIRIIGTTTKTLMIGAYAYKSGMANVSYSWSGTDSTCCNGMAPCGGNFNSQQQKGEITYIGEIPIGKKDLYITMNATADLDIQLYDLDATSTYAEGKSIIGWCKEPCNRGLLDDRALESVIYQGLLYEYSGYNGVDGQKGNEYIKITGVTNRRLMMASLAYEGGVAQVEYSYFEVPA